MENKEMNLKEIVNKLCKVLPFFNVSFNFSKLSAI